MSCGKHSYLKKRKDKEKIKKETKTKSQIALGFVVFVVVVISFFKFNNIIAFFQNIQELTNNFIFKFTYNIAYDSNTGTGTMAPQQMIYNVEAKLNANTFTKTGYTFKGWSSLPEQYQEIEYIESSGKQYIDTGVVGKSGLESIADIMYVNVPQDAALLGSRQDNTRTYLIYSYPKKWCMGYGYYTSSQTQIIENERYKIYSKIYPGEQIIEVNDENVYLGTNENEIDTNLNIYLFSLNYNNTATSFTSARVYSLKILENGITIRNFIPCYRKEDSEIGLYDTIEDKFYTNQGRETFLKGENSASYVDEEKVINIGDATFYAQWEEEVYNITYNLDGAISSNPQIYTINSENLILNNPTKEGYTFKGWSGTELVGDENLVVTIEQGSIGDREYFANFVPNTYTIEFNANGGTGSMPNIPMTYDTSCVLTKNIYTKTCHEFLGWNTFSDGTGTSFLDLEVVNNLTTTNNGTVVLYAQWSGPQVKYAVQIYGINQDVDEEGNTLGLTFGPATGASYNNSYVTHRYVENEEGTYNVEVVTTTITTDETEENVEVLLDANDNPVTRTEEQVAQRQNINLHNMSWEEIAAVSDKTLFEDCMLCGDTKSVKMTWNDQLKTENVYEQTGDGAGILVYTVNEYYRIWNPSQEQNSYVGSEQSGVELTENEINYGSNGREAGGYSSSHIRATLIGENEKTNKGYAGDVNLTTSNCVFTCIQEDLRNLIISKKVKYITGDGYQEGQYQINEDISDSIWLFSDREIKGKGEYSGFNLEGIGTSGIAYDRFENNQSRYYLSTYTTDSVTAGTTTLRQSYDETSNYFIWWLRSPALRNAHNPRFVYFFGYMTNNRSYYSYGLSFGFCIR